MNPSLMTMSRSRRREQASLPGRAEYISHVAQQCAQISHRLPSQSAHTEHLCLCADHAPRAGLCNRGRETRRGAEFARPSTFGARIV
jgi:hypothetical protein